MPLSDKQFREEFKPLQVPASYSAADSQQDRTIFALAALGEATAAEVTQKIEELEPGISTNMLAEQTSELLTGLFNKGLLNGGKKDDQMYFNLNKITQANTGDVDPELLEPGID
jgi:hypothetical protein